MYFVVDRPTHTHKVIELTVCTKVYCPLTFIRGVYTPHIRYAPFLLFKGLYSCGRLSREMWFIVSAKPVDFGGRWSVCVYYGSVVVDGKRSA